MSDIKANDFEHSEEDRNKVIQKQTSLLVKQLASDLKELKIDSVTCLEVVDQNGAHREYRLKFTF